MVFFGQVLRWALFLLVTLAPLLARAQELPPPEPPRQTAEAEEAPRMPSRRALLIGGGAMLGAEYFAGMLQHEASHWVAARLAGIEGVRLRLFPKIVEGHLLFASTWFEDPSWREKLSRREHALFLLAPKLPNVLVLGGYALLLETHRLPRNPWARLALTVYAAGNWIDFSKELFYSTRLNDLSKLYALYGLEEKGARHVLRLGHLLLAAGAGYEVGKGLYQLFRAGGNSSPKGASERRRSGTGLRLWATPGALHIGVRF